MERGRGRGRGGEGEIDGEGEREGERGRGGEGEIDGEGERGRGRDRWRAGEGGEGGGERGRVVGCTIKKLHLLVEAESERLFVCPLSWVFLLSPLCCHLSLLSVGRVNV